MAAPGELTVSPRPFGLLSAYPVAATRLAIAAVVFAMWELLARSGLLFEDVVPPIPAIVRALGTLLAAREFYANLQTTAGEVGTALLIGGSIGFLTGLVLGANRFLARAFEAYLYYLGPTPKIIFFPIMIMWFGTGAGSKIAMGAVSCFFPVALCTAAGMRGIDAVLIRVGRSFRANAVQMAAKIYLPAMREPVLNGIRLGLGVAIIGVLLAETKLSNRGLGFMVIDHYAHFDMPAMYALIIVIFALAVMTNAVVSRLGGAEPGQAAAVAKAGGAGI
jgi:ABC-type nitrate/sulfonate/bicarbonate transport system permease component